jgi:hypothetical protein
VGATFSAPVQTGPGAHHDAYRVFPGGKVRPGRAADHSPPSSAVIIADYSYTSTHPLGHTGPVTGLFTFTFYFRLEFANENSTDLVACWILLSSIVLFHEV